MRIATEIAAVAADAAISASGTAVRATTYDGADVDAHFERRA